MIVTQCSEERRRFVVRVAVTLMSWALASAAAAAQGETQQPKPLEPSPLDVVVDGEYLVLSIDEGGGVPIIDFVKLAEKLTGKVFTYSPNDLTSTADPFINFLGNKRIRRDNFFPFFQTMLYVKGFATLIRGDADTEVIEILVIQGKGRTELGSSAFYVMPDDLQRYANQTGVPILTSIPLHHISATVATNQLRPFFASNSGVSSGLTLGAAGKALLLQGFGPQVFAAYQLIKLIDLEPEVPEQVVRLHRLEHAGAEEIHPLVEQALDNRRARQGQGVSGAQLNVTPQTPLKVIPHTTLNAILLVGQRRQLQEAQEIIAELDVPADEVDGDTHVIRLRNLRADEVYGTLQQFLQASAQAERQGQQGRGAGARQPRRSVVVPHKQSNSLLISGTASEFRRLQKMIEDLDRRQPQILIECAVIELSTTASERLGVELGLVDIAAGSFTRPFGFTSFGLTSFDDRDGDGIPDTRLPDFSSPLSGFTGGILSSDDFAMPIVVSAVAGDSDANILSLPSIVVNNNVRAVLTNQEERPQQEVVQNATSSVGGAGAPRSAGINLSISPSISANDFLRLEVDLSVSRFVTAFDPSAVTAGVVAERSIFTEVTLPNGHTMVVGGMMEDVKNESSSGIPILKDIPLLGRLFQSHSNGHDKTNLFFFVTPHILDEEDFSDLAEHSFRKKLEAAEYIGHRRLQLVDHSWRASRPEVLEDPGSTLEDIDARGGFDIPIYVRP